MIDPSPFLHRHDIKQERKYRYSASAHVAAEIDRGKAIATLERLRYKRYYLNAIDLHWRIMQRLGDVGRVLFPWIGAGGWNGIGGGRLGGGRP